MRALNPFVHIDYEKHGERLVKTSNGEPFPDDEPVFIFRGRDRLAIPALLAYQRLAEQDGVTDYMLDRVATDLETFRRFAEEHPERMKQPGITRGK